MTAVSRETDQKLCQYQQLLHKWQEKINLISPTTLADSWHRHFEDSLQILPHIPDGAKILYDLGSGAGFPGLVTAIARPDLSVTLVESDAKKCAFLSAVARETECAIKIQNTRIEAAVTNLPAPDMITARALAPLDKLFAYVWPWVEANPTLTLLFPKGAGWVGEIDAAKQAGWSFEVKDFPSITEPEARILLFTNLRKTSA